MINKLIANIKKTNAPIVVGLDPMLNYVPEHVQKKAFAEYGETLEGAAAVSYTHLSDAGRSAPAASRGSAGRTPAASGCGRTNGPVSYTHLDVYKRQVRCRAGKSKGNRHL